LKIDRAAGELGVEFSGGMVNFGGVEFSGGTVDFNEADDWSSPPTFSWTDTTPWREVAQAGLVATQLRE
jgi:hypothetical protein